MQFPNCVCKYPIYIFNKQKIVLLEANNKNKGEKLKNCFITYFEYFPFKFEDCKLRFSMCTLEPSKVNELPEFSFLALCLLCSLLFVPRSELRISMEHTLTIL